MKTAPAGGAEPDIPSVILIGVILALVVVISIFGVEAAYYYLAARENEVKVVGTTNPELARYRDEQDSRLNTWRWVDKEKGLVAMPIERAMALEVEEKTGGQSAASSLDRRGGARTSRGPR